MYTGDIVHTHDDFLGKSIYVKHGIKDKSENSLYTIYGHTIPENHHVTGKRVHEGDIIAEIASLSESNKILPHLHITIAWLPKSLPYHQFNWETIGNPRLVTLCNPLEYINTRYTFVKIQGT